MELKHNVNSPALEGLLDGAIKALSWLVWFDGYKTGFLSGALFVVALFVIAGRIKQRQ